MTKNNLKGLATISAVGAAIGTCTWYLVALSSPATIASAVSSGIIGACIAVLFLVGIKDQTTETEKDWLIIAGVVITILTFGITVLLNKIARDILPNHTLAGWPGALTCIAASVITTFLAFYLAVLAEDLINDFHHKKTQSNLVSEDSNYKETQTNLVSENLHHKETQTNLVSENLRHQGTKTNLESKVTVEAIRPIAASSKVSH
ncbi:MAG: hypothetical protein PG981_001347 [Wolbachia endosymbiont of Ctenocephalides orientis wCori]|nr:MAG: hypothetical protein PG981_001347 [Wolbachia endosymbiont of Ctenocephalides orientis wCori]